MTIRHKGKLLRRLRRDALLRDGAGLSDKELLERFLGRQDEAAFEALVRRHGPMVWGVCRRLLPSHHDAEDAFQATFLVLVRKAASISSRELLANWLYGVAQRTSLRARTAAAKRYAREQPLTDQPATEAAPHEVWDDLRPLLDRELGGLPEKYRVPILLCDLQGRTRAEAARQLGCPEGTVAGRLARARVLLAKRLARRGVTLSAGALAVVVTDKAGAAGVPGAVIVATVKAASLVAAGSAAALGALSGPVAALMEGVVKSMLLHKLKVGLALALVAAVIGVGGSGLAYRQLQAADPQQRQGGNSATAPGPNEPGPDGRPALNAQEAKKRNDVLKAVDAKQRELEDLRRAVAEMRAKEAAIRERENEGLQKQLAQLKDLLLAREVENIKLKAEVDLARKEAAVWETRCRDAEAQSRSLKDKLQEVMAHIARPLLKESQQPVPRNLRGVVTEVAPEGYVKISLGSDQGVKEGQLLQVYRLQPKPAYLGTLKVMVVQPSTALAVGKNAQKLRPGDEVCDQILKATNDAFKAATPPSDQKIGPSTKAQLQGSWRVVAAVSGGKQMFPRREPGAPDPNKVILREVRCIFAGDKVTMQTDELIRHGSYTVDATKTPSRIDMHFLVGGSDYEEPMTMLGVFAVEGNTLKLSLGHGQRRPLRLDSSLKGRMIYYILEREPGQPKVGQSQTAGSGNPATP